MDSIYFKSLKLWVQNMEAEAYLDPIPRFYWLYSMKQTNSSISTSSCVP